MGERIELVERVARAIARGCNLNPDAISPKAAKHGHQIPEWFFFIAAAKEAIEEIIPAPVDTHRMAETGTGSVRSMGSAVAESEAPNRANPSNTNTGD